MFTGKVRIAFSSHVTKACKVSHCVKYEQGLGRTITELRKTIEQEADCESNCFHDLKGFPSVLVSKSWLEFPSVYTIIYFQRGLLSEARNVEKQKTSSSLTCQLACRAVRPSIGGDRRTYSHTQLSEMEHRQVCGVRPGGRNRSLCDLISEGKLRQNLHNNNTTASGAARKLGAAALQSSLLTFFAFQTSICKSAMFSGMFVPGLALHATWRVRVPGLYRYLVVHRSTHVDLVKIIGSLYTRDRTEHHPDSVRNR
ncbi:hypothetical protein RRG08_062728 [Elysia crispata]|uniref:Uncharacterized protein n=1 Tax=Elysia crispata TaxID=231223 RepID=A0AAE1ABQ6_9GAST|nr:hypothetical protein RRG08_062728 [Elysia crispata]